MQYYKGKHRSDKLNIDISRFGLKGDYDFREIKISISGDINDLSEKLLNVVAPAIHELESAGLINGYHFIPHGQLDLRISCTDWIKNEKMIQEVLERHQVPNELGEKWILKEADHYGGNQGVLLCYNNLEFNSRLCLALFELINDTTNDQMRQTFKSRYPGQWIHYLYIQCGYYNPQQVEHELRDAFTWLEIVLRNNKGNDWVRTFGMNTIAWIRGVAEEIEKKYLKS